MAANQASAARFIDGISTALVITLLAAFVLGTSSSASSPSTAPERTVEIRTLLDLSEEQLDRIQRAAESLPYALPPIVVVARCSGIEGYAAGTEFWGCYFDGDRYIRLTVLGASQLECAVRDTIVHELAHLWQHERQMAAPGLRVGGDEPGWWNWREVDARAVAEPWGCGETS